MKEKFYLYLVNEEDEMVVRLQFDSEAERESGKRVVMFLDENIDCFEEIPDEYLNYDFYDEDWNPLNSSEEE